MFVNIKVAILPLFLLLLSQATAQLLNFWVRPAGDEICRHGSMTRNCTTGNPDFDSPWGGCMLNPIYGRLYCCSPSAGLEGCWAYAPPCMGSETSTLPAASQTTCRFGPKDVEWCCDSANEECPGPTWDWNICIVKSVKNPLRNEPRTVRNDIGTLTFTGPLGVQSSTPPPSASATLTGAATVTSSSPISASNTTPPTAEAIRSAGTVSPFTYGVVIGTIIAILIVFGLSFYAFIVWKRRQMRKGDAEIHFPVREADGSSAQIHMLEVSKGDDEMHFPVREADGSSAQIHMLGVTNGDAEIHFPVREADGASVQVHMLEVPPTEIQGSVVEVSHGNGRVMWQG